MISTRVSRSALASGTRYICAPMGVGHRRVPLAAAVSRAGGLGIVGGAYAGTVGGEPDLEAELARAKSGKFGVGFITEQERSGGTRSAGCLLADHLFLHLLLHFLRCVLCNVSSDHPSVTLGINNGSTAVAPKHIHHGPLGRGADVDGLGNHLV